MSESSGHWIVNARGPRPLNPRNTDPDAVERRHVVNLGAGDRLGGLVIVRQLGRGGMGVVYEAVDSALGRSVAVKVLDRTAGDHVARERFLREARAVARIRHPNVVEAYNVVQDGDLTYMVMELMRGGNCSDLFEGDSRLAPAEATRIIRQAAAGLGAAHALGIVHRDVKPANLMLDEHGTVKVADFGLAKWTDVSQCSLTRSGDTVGTPLYMSPEQCRGEETDARSDLYSLGAAYYCLLTGAAPFRADHPTGVIFQHLTKPVPDPRKFRPDLPEGCRRIIGRAMAKQPNARYRSASEMIADLDAIDHSPPMVRGSSALWAALRRAPRPTAPGRRAAVLAAAAGAAFLATGLTSWLLLRPQSDQPLPGPPASSSALYGDSGSDPSSADAAGAARTLLRARFASLQQRGRTGGPADLRDVIAGLELLRTECLAADSGPERELARAAESELELMRERLAVRTAGGAHGTGEAGGAGGRVLFSAAPAPDLTLGPGWSGDGRMLTLAADAAPADAGISVGGPAFDDFTMRVGVKWASTDSDDNRLLFFYRERDGAGFGLCWSPSKAGFDIIRGNASASLLRLRRRAPEGQWDDLVLQVSGRRHRLLVNGQVAGEFEHDDTRPGALRVWAAGGRVSLREWRLEPGAGP